MQKLSFVFWVVLALLPILETAAPGAHVHGNVHQTQAFLSFLSSLPKVRFKEVQVKQVFILIAPQNMGFKLLAVPICHQPASAFNSYKTSENENFFFSKPWKMLTGVVCSLRVLIGLSWQPA